MSPIDIDAMVNKWLIAKWLKDSDNTSDFREYVRYDAAVHGPVSGLKVVTADADWDCLCYSSWTREDEFVVTAVIATAAGEVGYSYGRWGDFPSFIEELDVFRINTTCPYESEEG